MNRIFSFDHRFIVYIVIYDIRPFRISYTLLYILHRALHTVAETTVIITNKLIAILNASTRIILPYLQYTNNLIVLTNNHFFKQRVSIWRSFWHTRFYLHSASFASALSCRATWAEWCAYHKVSKKECSLRHSAPPSERSVDWQRAQWQWPQTPTKVRTPQRRGLFKTQEHTSCITRCWRRLTCSGSCSSSHWSHPQHCCLTCSGFPTHSVREFNT